ncbi:MAG: hypothetical protein LBT59_16510, partial [Clostridiales bacterium]|nr:hypothetical protein [Clostridiales bacterium]
MKNKKVISVVISLVVLIAVITGTFAWISMGNTTTTGIIGTDDAPGGTVHDDFDGVSNKDIYVENWGTVPIFVRVRLSEYMEVGNLAGTTSPDKEAKSIVAGATLEDKDSWSTLYFPYGIDPFREYWGLTFGGQKYYKPVEPKDQKSGFIATDVTEYNGTEPGIKKTRSGEIWDMAYFVTNGGPEGDLWVADTDGWIYWASPLNPGEATGLLLDQITKLKNITGGQYYYGITADTQMATAEGNADSPGDFNSFSLEENGGWTPNAKALLHNITGNGRIEYEVPKPMAEPGAAEPPTDANEDEPAEPGAAESVTDAKEADAIEPATDAKDDPESGTVDPVTGAKDDPERPGVVEPEDPKVPITTDPATGAGEPGVADPATGTGEPGVADPSRDPIKLPEAKPDENTDYDKYPEPETVIDRELPEDAYDLKEKEAPKDTAVTPDESLLSVLSGFVNSMSAVPPSPTPMYVPDAIYMLTEPVKLGLADYSLEKLQNDPPMGLTFDNGKTAHRWIFTETNMDTKANWTWGMSLNYKALNADDFGLEVFYNYDPKSNVEFTNDEISWFGTKEKIEWGYWTLTNSPSIFGSIMKC